MFRCTLGAQCKLDLVSSKKCESPFSFTELEVEKKHVREYAKLQNVRRSPAFSPQIFVPFLYLLTLPFPTSERRIIYLTTSHGVKDLLNAAKGK